MSAVETLPRDRPLSELAPELDTTPERLRYLVRVGLIRVYRVDRLWWIRRTDERWVRQLVALTSLGVSVEALADAARRRRLSRLLTQISGASRAMEVPSWLR